jgi:ATP-dependent protease ClpP protease subunit
MKMASGRIDSSLQHAASVPAALAAVLAAGTSSFTHACMRSGAVAELRPYHSLMRGDDVGEGIIEINGDIVGDAEYWVWGGGTSSRSFSSELKALGEITRLTVRLNCRGGVGDEAIQIYNSLQAAKAEGLEVIVEVGAICYSAATLILCAGDEVRVASNSVLMFHNPSGRADGEAKDIRAYADYLDTCKKSAMAVYMAFNDKYDETSLSQMLDSTTWYIGQEAVDGGWATSVLGNPAPVDAVMTFDLATMSTETASDAVKAQLEVLQASAATDAAPEVPDDVATLRTELSDLASTVGTLAAAISAVIEKVTPPVETTEPQAPAVQLVDPRNPAVLALASLARLDGRTDEFTSAIGAGANLAQLQSRFIDGQVGRSMSLTTVAVIDDSTPKPAAAREERLDVASMYAELNKR